VFPFALIRAHSWTLGIPRYLCSSAQSAVPWDSKPDWNAPKKPAILKKMKKFSLFFVKKRGFA
jgi:hypothetical protein